MPTQEQVIQFCHDNSIIDFLQVEIVPTPDGCARLELDVKNFHSNPYGILHEGRQIFICECELKDAEENIYAKAHATFFAISKFEE